MRVRRTISIRRIRMVTRWRCWSSGSTLFARSGSRSRPQRSYVSASNGATALRASITIRSAAILSSNTSMPPAVSPGARTLALPSFMVTLIKSLFFVWFIRFAYFFGSILIGNETSLQDRRRKWSKSVPDFEVGFSLTAHMKSRLSSLHLFISFGCPWV